MVHNTSQMGTPSLTEKKFSILQEICSSLIAIENISDIADFLLDFALNCTYAERGSLMLINEKGDLSIVSARGLDAELLQSTRVKMGEDIAGTIASDRAPILVEDIRKDPRFHRNIKDSYKTPSFVSCPIMSKGKLLGVLNINDKKDGSPFTEGEFELIKVIANQAANAFEHAFLMNKLRSKAAEIEETNKNLIDADMDKTEFLTIASHELRTPLNAIKGAIYYLQKSDKPTKNELKEFYEIISNETNKLVYITENLLDFLRLEDETKVIRKSVIDLADLLKETLQSKTCMTVLERKNLALRIHGGDKVDIVGDRIRVSQFFINLVEGLTHYLEKNDSISIAILDNAGDRSEVRVQITLSRALPETVIPYLFYLKEIFKTKNSEHMLKLYLARKVAELHRWDIAAANIEENFLVTITIPRNTLQRMEAFIDTTTDMFLEFVSELLDLNLCSLMLRDEFTGELVIKSARGLDEDIIKRTRIRVGDSIAGWVALKGNPLLIDDIETDPHFGRKNISHYNTKSLLSIPLKIKDRVIGVLNLNNKRTAKPFTTKDLHLASVISERFSNFMHRLTTGGYTENDFKQFLTSFDSLIQAEKRYHKKKSIAPDLMDRLLSALGVSEEERKLGLYVSLVYDLGLMLIDEHILKTKKKLRPSDIRTIKVHPKTTVGLLQNFEFSEDVRKAILHHHERYDGTGYPDGLRGDEIPFLSRVLCIIDSYCAMTSESPYRRILTKHEALREMKSGAGIIYDPKIVEIFEKVMVAENGDSSV
jgi:HD-GYP domain-containing protein (c-di-GMP phosphodiesterase class II)